MPGRGLGASEVRMGVLGDIVFLIGVSLGGYGKGTLAKRGFGGSQVQVIR